MKLVVAEKPSVASAIYPILGANSRKNGYVEGNGYIVSWCFGHLAGLALPEAYGEKWSGWKFEQLPMIPEHWKFVIKPDKKEQFNILKSLMNDSRVDEIICATDADREGECIFRYVYNLAKCSKPVKRLWVSSLEETAIKDGFANLKDGKNYDNLFNAGFCRAKADWLVGMNGSRLFSIRYHSKLNTGRVQTPTLAMIVKRDYDVKNFVKQKYFTVFLNCGNFTAVSEKIENADTADKIVLECSEKNALVTELKREIKTVNPPKLYDLTTLQREANKKFGYTAQQTLTYLQALYEAKLATYPRTDSQYLSDDMEQTAVDVVNAIFKVFTNFGTPQTINVKRCINNPKVTGHHAIIPTINIETSNLSALKDEHKNILMMISAKLVMATADVHKYEAVKVVLKCENTVFSANGKTVIEKGWKEFEENAKFNSDEENDNQKSLPDISQGQIFEKVSAGKTEHWTSPPKPFTEAALLSAMEHAGQEIYDDDTEKKGLGTPATRAGIIEGLVKHGYAERKGKQITSTEKGKNLINVVPDEVKSPMLTAEWEMQLQSIERSEYSKEKFMNNIVSFLDEICKKYGSFDESVSFGGTSEFETIGKCPKCGNSIKKGQYGFYCTGKCGMNVAKVYGKELTELQLKKLLDGNEISYTSNGKKTIVLPKVMKNEYNGKTYFQWETKK